MAFAGDKDESDRNGSKETPESDDFPAVDGNRAHKKAAGGET